MYDLDNKVAIITGAGGKSGIGRSVATRLAKEGSKIIVTDIVENPYPEEGWNGLSSVVEEIVANGGEAVQILSDVTDFSSINNLIKEAIKKFGRVDILVNNAGATADKDRVPIFDLDENEWDKVIDVNLKGVFLFTKAFSKQLILQNQGGGSAL